MPTLAELRKNSVLRGPAESRAVADDSLISDIRSHVRSSEIIERKLQAALEASRSRPANSFSPRH